MKKWWKDQSLTAIVILVLGIVFLVIAVVSWANGGDPTLWSSLALLFGLSSAGISALSRRHRNKHNNRGH